MLFSLARGIVARASSDGPEASKMVEAKLKEIEILLDHYEQANRARERDADVGEGEAVRNGQGEGAAADEAHPVLC